MVPAVILVILWPIQSARSLKPRPTIKHCHTTEADPTSCYGNGRSLTLPSDNGTVSVLCLMKIARAGFSQTQDTVQ